MTAVLASCVSITLFGFAYLIGMEVVDAELSSLGNRGQFGWSESECQHLESLFGRWVGLPMLFQCLTAAFAQVSIVVAVGLRLTVARVIVVIICEFMIVYPLLWLPTMLFHLYD